MQLPRVRRSEQLAVSSEHYLGFYLGVDISNALTSVIQTGTSYDLGHTLAFSNRSNFVKKTSSDRQARDPAVGFYFQFTTIFFHRCRGQEIFVQETVYPSFGASHGYITLQLAPRSWTNRASGTTTLRSTPSCSATINCNAFQISVWLRVEYRVASVL